MIPSPDRIEAKLVFRVATLLFVALIGWGIFRILNQQRDPGITFRKYPGFGIFLPQPYAIHGIDVSAHNGQINWDLVQSMQSEGLGLSFAFIKATEGYGKIDLQFPRNWAGSRAAKISRGAYHFFLATKDGRKQAGNFIEAVQLKSGDFPPVLDVEHLYGVRPDSMRVRMQAWLEAVESHYGVRPIIYTNVKFYEKYLDGYFDHYPLWVAHYLQREKPRIRRDWLFWQHSEKGRVNGVRTAVDFNVFAGTAGQFEKLLIP